MNYNSITFSLKPINQIVTNFVIQGNKNMLKAKSLFTTKRNRVEGKLLKAATLHQRLIGWLFISVVGSIISMVFQVTSTLKKIA